MNIIVLSVAYFIFQIHKTNRLWEDILARSRRHIGNGKPFWHDREDIFAREDILARNMRTVNRLERVRA